MMVFGLTAVRLWTLLLPRRQHLAGPGSQLVQVVQAVHAIALFRSSDVVRLFEILRKMISAGE